MHFEPTSSALVLGRAAGFADADQSFAFLCSLPPETSHSDWELEVTTTCGDSTSSVPTVRCYHCHRHGAHYAVLTFLFLSAPRHTIPLKQHHSEFVLGDGTVQWPAGTPAYSAPGQPDRAPWPAQLGGPTQLTAIQLAMVSNQNSLEGSCVTMPTA